MNVLLAFVLGFFQYFGTTADAGSASVQSQTVQSQATVVGQTDRTGQTDESI